MIRTPSWIVSRPPIFDVASSIKMKDKVGQGGPCLTQRVGLNVPIAVCPGREYLKAPRPSSQRQLIPLSILPKNPEQSDTSGGLETHALVTAKTGNNDDVSLGGSVEMNERCNEPGTQGLPGIEWVVLETGLDPFVGLEQCDHHPGYGYRMFDACLTGNFFDGKFGLLVLAALSCYLRWSEQGENHQKRRVKTTRNGGIKSLLSIGWQSFS